MRRPAAFFLWFAGVFCAAAQTPRAPYLYFRLNTPRGMQALAPGRPAEVPNNKAIALEVCIRASKVEDRFEQLQIRALNQHPEFFANRPPPNIEITLRRVLPGGRPDSGEAMPFRVNSPGGGKDLEVYFVNVDLDMLEEKVVRLQKAGKFVEWMLAQSPDDARSHLLETPAARQRLIEHFEESYVNNPPGDYEITARYTPTTPDNWKGTLVSAPVRLRVVSAGDFFDVIRAQQAGKAGVK